MDFRHSRLKVRLQFCEFMNCSAYLSDSCDSVTPVRRRTGPPTEYLSDSCDKEISVRSNTGSPTEFHPFVRMPSHHPKPEHRNVHPS